MKHTVIIGGGPIGLYLAYKLHKAKVKNIIIFDPRTGEYVRPGHVNLENFIKLERALGKTEFSTRFGHITENYPKFTHPIDKLNTFIKIQLFGSKHEITHRVC